MRVLYMHMFYVQHNTHYTLPPYRSNRYKISHNITYKGKTKVDLYTKKAYRGRRGTALLILKLGTRWR